jgi:ABC-type Fe3+ transport system permease subunit
MSLLAASPLSIYWQLPVLIVVISMVYSATRFDEWRKIFREALTWGVRMTTFLLLIAVVLFVLAKFI